MVGICRSKKCNKFGVCCCSNGNIVLSGTFSFISLIPNVGTKIRSFFNKGQRPSQVNLLLFEHIRHFTGRNYLKEVYKKYYNETPSSLQKKELDLSDEIVYNAGLTSNKYYFFKCGVILDFASIILLGVGIIFG